MLYAAILTLEAIPFLEGPCPHPREVQTSKIHLHRQNLHPVLEGSLMEVC